ncbi:hypothetical protein [Specibacter cremeus]|uniref:hypothetical protein n=1 Tax=Specibacter cremeus TaxID=1629051 RepID=UPI000F794AA1|nr:hypothetical protein [Specibacter cremeus]
MTLLFLAAGAITTVTNNSGSVPRFFVVGAIIWSVVCAVWYWRNPSWWLAPARNYAYLAGGTVLGVLLLALVPFLRGCGPWLVLAAAVIVYGVWERTRLIVTTGAVLAGAGLLAWLVTADVWAGALHLVSTVALAFATNRLYTLKYGRRRESQKADPGFIGRFEEVDDAGDSAWR